MPNPEAKRSRELAVVRHITLTVPRRETSAKRCTKGKRMKAALDARYLLKVLTGQMRAPSLGLC